MSTYSTLSREPRTALKVVELIPSMFADDWRKKPTETMQCGLRLVSEGDIERIRAKAVKDASEFIVEAGEDRIAAFNDAIMVGLVARCTCMPNNAQEPFFEMPEDDVPNALTPEAIRFLCNEYDLLKIEACNYLREAEENDLIDLSALLLDEDAWLKLSVGTARRLKRIAYHLLVELDPEIRGA